MLLHSYRSMPSHPAILPERLASGAFNNDHLPERVPELDIPKYDRKEFRRGTISGNLLNENQTE